MAETKSKVLVVVAAGPLIGVGVAALFAQKGFTHIALLSRNAERLRQDAKDGGLPIGAGATNIIVKAYAADVTIPDNLNRALRQVEADFGAPEVVVYNGARVSTASLSNWDTWTEEDMVMDFRVRLCFRRGFLRILKLIALYRSPLVDFIPRPSGHFHCCLPRRNLLIQHLL
jgi:NAD(P)-dependent dehydrogenase (short-subunit alcohol dehydrogenase family)